MTINGKEAKFYWGMIAYEVYLESILKSKRRVNALSVSSISSILWGGILNHYERIQEDCPLKYSEVYDHVETIAVSGEVNDEIQECIKKFNASVFVQNGLKKIEDSAADLKKKSDQINSEETPLELGSNQPST